MNHRKLENKLKYKFENRRYVIGGAVIALVIIFIVRLFYLQIIDSDYKAWADSNAFLKKTIYPSRGILYDRNEKLLVYNQPSYDVMMIMREVQPFDTLDFCRILGITKEQYLKRIADMKNRRLNPGYSSYTPQIFMSQLSAEECGILQEKLYKFPGFYVQNRTIREYAYPNAALLLGNVGEVNTRDIEADSYYVPGDNSGRTGIEGSYEKVLRGEKGVEILLRDAHGRIKGHYEDGKYDVPAVSGKNLKLSIDIDLQAYGEKLMKNKLGGIVMIACGAAMGGHLKAFTVSAAALLIYMAMISAVAYSLWGVLLKYNPVSKVTVFGFMNPVIGVILSALLLDETEALGVSSVLALGLVCVGIYIVNAKGKD